MGNWCSIARLDSYCREQFCLQVAQHRIQKTFSHGPITSNHCLAASCEKCNPVPVPRVVCTVHFQFWSSPRAMICHDPHWYSLGFGTTGGWCPAVVIRDPADGPADPSATQRWPGLVRGLKRRHGAETDVFWVGLDASETCVKVYGPIWMIWTFELFIVFRFSMLHDEIYLHC